MLALTVAATSSAWNAGGSIFTFYFPIGLFVVVGVLLCLQFGRPHAVPGRRPVALARTSVSARPPGSAIAGSADLGQASPQASDSASRNSDDSRPEYDDTEEPGATKVGG